MKNVAVFIIVVAILASIFWAGRRTAPTIVPDIRIDTLRIFDTIRDPYPVEVIRYVSRVDSIPFVVYVPSDTVERLVFVPIPIEQTTYETDDYKAVIEGYRARLLSMDVYRQTVHIDRVERYNIKPRWGLGVQAGYSYDIRNNNFTPTVGVGVHYNLFTW